MVYKYTTGEIMESFTLNDQNQKHGLFQSWWVNGQLQNQLEYINGEPYGLRYNWTSSGSLKWIIFYQNEKTRLLDEERA